MMILAQFTCSRTEYTPSIYAEADADAEAVAVNWKCFCTNGNFIGVEVERRSVGHCSFFCY